MLYIPLTRQATDPDYSSTFYLNVDQSLSFARALDNSHTRIRGTSVYTPVPVTRSSGLTEIDPQAALSPGEESVIQVLVLETPDQILALIESAQARSVRRAGTRIIGTPATSPMG